LKGQRGAVHTWRKWEMIESWSSEVFVSDERERDRDEEGVSDEGVSGGVRRGDMLIFELFE
jgi:hypothetical protein